jgi:hypothetical protein
MIARDADSHVDTATCSHVGWRRRLNQKWNAVGFGNSRGQAHWDLAAYLRREGGRGVAVVLPRGEDPQNYPELCYDYVGGLKVTFTDRPSRE